MVDFHIELILGVIPIFSAPYRIAPTKIAEIGAVMHKRLTYYREKLNRGIYREKRKRK